MISTRGGAAAVLALLLGSTGCTYVSAPAGALDPTVQRVEVRVGELERQFHIYVPLALPPGAPLLIAFHASNSSGLAMRHLAGATLERMAREHGFIVAYPDGMWGYFDDCRKRAPYRAHVEHVDDIAFSRALVARLAADHAIDGGRVYALGYSNGAQMALRLALEAPDLVAGVIAIAANVPTPDNMDCAPRDGLRPSVVLIEGTRDPLNPYAGGEVSLLGMGDRGSVMSAPDSARWFARRYGMADDPDVALPPLRYEDLSARIEIWGRASPRVELISIEGGGHTMPVADFRFPFVLGRTFGDPVLLEDAWSAVQP